MISTNISTRNALLRLLNPQDLAALTPNLKRVPLDRNFLLVKANEPITTVYFPEDGVVSIVSDAPQGGRTEVGILGREGMSATNLLLGVETSPQETFVQVQGKSALAIPADVILAAFEASAEVRRVLLRYVQAFAEQVVQTAISNAHHSLQERLARWLLMCNDRLDGEEIALTHDFIAMMLAVRRTGVTDAIHILEGLGLIRARRGNITVLDRVRLEAHAGEAYGRPEAEYQRLLGVAGKPSRSPVANSVEHAA